MKEKLIIKNFGPIKEVDLDLGRFTVLIGEQATGKSTVAKVLAVCRYFSYIVEETSDSVESVFYNGLTSWGLSGYSNADTIIEYSCSHYSLNCKYNSGIQKILYDNDGNEIGEEEIGLELNLEPKSEEFKNLLIELDKVAPKKRIEVGSMKLVQYRRIPTSFYLNDVKNVLDNPFYLPTERSLQSIFSLGQNSIPNIGNFLFNYFSKVDDIQRSFSHETYIEPLDIYYVNRNGIGYIRKKEDKDFYLLSNAASGYQSTVPVVLVLKYYEQKRRAKTFLIEEPELNLFPSAQNKLMQYLVDKTMNYGNRMLLTTHSPYILTSLINMMYAYQVGQTNEEKVSRKMNKKYWLNPDEVSCYRMLSDGTAENIIDDDGLIKAEKIDEVSKGINKEFNDIMDIELGVDEAA